MMRVHELIVKSESCGTSTISLWVECYDTDDIDALIAWLKLARRMSDDWQRYRKVKAIGPSG